MSDDLWIKQGRTTPVSQDSVATFTVEQPPPQPPDRLLALLVEIGKRATALQFVSEPVNDLEYALRMLSNVKAIMAADTRGEKRGFSICIAALAIGLIQRIDAD